MSTITPNRARVISLQITTDEKVEGARVEGQIKGTDGNPAALVHVELKSDNYSVSAETDRNGSFTIRTAPGSYMLVVARDLASSLPLQLREHEVATTVWTVSASSSGLVLPLAEIRTVDIVWSDDLVLTVDTPWPGALFTWTATGGRLINYADAMQWVPPELPGRYLVQLIADWGYEGLAVDALILDVYPDGTVSIT